MSGEGVPVPRRTRGEWFTSSYSSGSASCVEVKFTAGATLVRDSKDPAGQPHLGFPAKGWSSFLDTITS